MEFFALVLLGIYSLVTRGRVTSLERRVDQLIYISGKVIPVFLLLLSPLAAAEDDSMILDQSTRVWFHNPDGSCVQCSIGMAGVWCNDENAATLLFESRYGKAERLGSWPTRVSQYCDSRGIRVYNVTGETVDDTYPWIKWAAKTGRYAAIGAGKAHFQTLYGYDPKRNVWQVCNNQTPRQIDEYTDQQFRQLHKDSGPWVVILEKPSSNPPELVQWWK